jgi:hypothetical protein
MIFVSGARVEFRIDARPHRYAMGELRIGREGVPRIEQFTPAPEPRQLELGRLGVIAQPTAGSA